MVRVFGVIFGALLLAAAGAGAEELTVGAGARFATVSNALAEARTGDRIVVKPGVYRETIVWPATQGITLVSEKGPDETVLEGDGRRPVIHMEGKLKWDTVVDGFTIRKGGGGFEPGRYGSGIDVVEASPTIRNCRIVENEARPYRGSGGIFLRDSRAVVEQNEVSRNRYQAERLHGGGICVWGGMPKIRRNLVEENAGDDTRYFSRGSGIRLRESQAVVEENIIRKNEATSVGSALYAEQGDRSCVFGNLIEKNRNSGGSSGAVFVEPNSDPQVGGDEPGEPNAIHDNTHLWKQAAKPEETVRNLSPAGLGREGRSFRANDWGGKDDRTLDAQLESINPKPKAADAALPPEAGPKRK